MTSANSSAESALRRDVRVIGLIGSAHCLSHFFQLTLAPLFPLIKAEFGVSYATLGALVSVFYVASGLCQFGAGFAVDRFGARPVLLGGIALLAGGVLAGGLVSGVYWLFPLVALMGIGNGVFHPADFAVLNANVAPQRLGHAYSTHGVGGSVGYAVAPIVSFGLGSAFGWRTSLLVLGALGLVALAAFATQKDAFRSRPHGVAPVHHSLSGSIDLFLQAPILLCFAYFCILTLATIGIQTFAGPALNAAYGIPIALATSALAAYLLGSTAGILVGGFLASQTAHHHRVAAVGLAIGGALMLLVALVPDLAAWAVAMFALTGFALGATGPSRDMIVRAATPPGASGRVYGFVYSGLDLGATIAPVAVGALIDHDLPRLAFGAIAVCLFLAIGTVLQVRRRAAPRRAVAAAE
ncbi:MAG TPA: MFS transporter [Casimicrobiaceae bacterium]|nr:MFS transporter [Casimicrobiaceae bacterium]